MADTAKRLAGPTQPGTSTGTLYTVPASTTTILRNIHVANNTAAAVTFTLAIGTAATAANRLYDAVSIPANSTLDWSGFLVLAAAETLQALASAGTSLTVTVSGVEVT